ncbi:hypothetical protein QBC35DRAFT_539116 [Podospora australis]|uniref:Uncharacterized protein n=1 Tax=Podospora australis TaxID=1536484 RepID=A0AAN6WN78_9PEZI|nr:hypothetical protein QBC35DRAFT_539116 [Podospora australis]
MAAVTVIANPLAEKRDKVLLFQSSDATGSLRVEPRHLETLEFKLALGAVDAGSVPRPLANPSQLVSMVYKDTVAVYGITGKNDADLQLTMVSPVYHKIKVKPVSGALAGCALKTGGMKGEKGWLYVLFNDGGETKLGEWELSSSAVNKHTLNADKLSTSTQLHAVFDEISKKRWVVYQNTDNEVVILDAERNKGFTIDDTDRVAAKTPLALAIVPNIAEPKKRRLVTYFLAKSGKATNVLHFANTSLEYKDPSWEEVEEKPRPVPGINVLLPWAQIDTYVDENKKRTLVFGLQTKTEGEEPLFNVIDHVWTSLED